MDVPKMVRKLCVSALCLIFAVVLLSYLQKRTKLAVDASIQSEKKEENGKPTEEPQFINHLTEDEIAGGNSLQEAGLDALSEYFGLEVPELAKKQGNLCIFFPKKNGKVSVSEKMIYRKVIISAPFSLSEDELIRRNGNSIYSGRPEYEAPVIPEEEKEKPIAREPKLFEEDPVQTVLTEETTDGYRITLELNTVYDVSVSEDSDYVYLCLQRPYEIYEHIVVIDAGHGGNDCGTSGGGSTEAAVNLAIVRNLKAMLEEQPEKMQNVKFYYTRLEDTLPDLSTRVEFANALHADFLLSVHCNYNPVSYVNGVDVLFSTIQKGNGKLSSRQLSELCLDIVGETTELKKKYIEERSSNLHLMKYCTMPCALFEFGYMSNRSDLKYITSEKGQMDCAVAVRKSIEEALKRLDE